MAAPRAPEDIVVDSLGLAPALGPEIVGLHHSPSAEAAQQNPATIEVSSLHGGFTPRLGRPEDDRIRGVMTYTITATFGAVMVLWLTSSVIGGAFFTRMTTVGTIGIPACSALLIFIHGFFFFRPS